MNEAKKDDRYRIVIDTPETTMLKQGLVIKGRYRVPYGQLGVPKTGQEVLKHLVIAGTHVSQYQTGRPYVDTFVFPDDFKDEGEGCSGAFHFDAFSCLRGVGGLHHFTCSIGNILSNTLKVLVES